MYEKILVPLDGSRLAEQALPYAGQIAKAFNSEVTLIGICEPGEAEHEETFQLYVASMEDVLRKITGSETVVKIQSTCSSGSAAGEILKYAEENGVNLIIMTSHGRSGAVPWSLGGTANKILQKASVPLLVVRAQEHPAISLRQDVFGRILVALDGSANSEAVLPYIAGFGRKLGSAIYLLHVVESGRHVHTIGGINYVPFKDQDKEQQKAKAITYLDGLTSHLEGVSNINYEVTSGDAAREIIKFSDEKNCSLIAVSSHGHSAISSWAFGSVTEKVLHTSKQSIFFVPSPGIRQK